MTDSADVIKHVIRTQTMTLMQTMQPMQEHSGDADDATSETSQRKHWTTRPKATDVNNTANVINAANPVVLQGLYD